VKQNPEFHYVMEDMERLRKKLDENRISLNEEVRKIELEQDKIRKELRAKDRLARQAEDTRIYRVTLDTVDSPNLQLIMYPGKLAATKKNVAPEAAGDAESDTADSENADEPRLDPLRDEALTFSRISPD
jgi:carboxyl-terminal processing protease